jgi:signal peptidase I
MLPTYYGVTTCVRPIEEKEQSKVKKIFEKIFHGKTNFYVKSDHSGDLEIPLSRRFTHSHSREEVVKFNGGHRRSCLGFFSTANRVCRLKIGNSEQEISLPHDCAIDEVLLKAFGGGHSSWQSIHDAFPAKFRIVGDTAWFRPGAHVEAGKCIVNFDRICGDVLFVNKLSYHFRRPKIGEAVVFRTEKIENLPGDPNYFIKRLVGQGGDTIQLVDGILHRNGSHISGSKIFAYENSKTNGYESYTSVGTLANQHPVRVNFGEYFVLGDNSKDSGDSRFWGFVPENEVIGSPLFVFYPLHRARFCK